MLALMLFFAMVVAVIETIAGYYIAYQQGLVDPDGYMRLVRIRDGLHSGGFTHIVAADNAGLGTVVYWSHLIDAVILALRMPLRLVLDDPAALSIAAASTGPILASLLAVVLIWAWVPLGQKRWLWTAPVVALLSPMLFVYGTFGYVHHHLPLALIAVLAAACAGRAVIGHSRAGLWCGIWSGVGIWLSPEALPYVLMAMGAIGVAWCLRPTVVAGALTSCGTAFAATTTAAMLADPPFGGWLSPEIDCLSIVFVVLAILVCGASWLLILIQRNAPSVRARSLCCLLIGMAVIGLWLWLFPSITRGLGGLVSPADAAVFFGAISEMQPVALDAHGIGLLTTGVLAEISALILWVHTRNFLWLYAAACGVVVLTLAVLHVRFVVYSEAIGALMIPAIMNFLSSPERSAQRQAILRAAVLALFILGPFLPAWAVQQKQAPAELTGSCNVKDIVPALAQQKNAIVLTEISDTPEILWRAPVRTVGSLYHRSIDAFIRARNAWRSGPSGDVPETVVATGASHILLCDLSAERSSLVSDLPPHTLRDRLARHEVPSWLHEVARAGGYSLYLIDR